MRKKYVNGILGGSSIAFIISIAHIWAMNNDIPGNRFPATLMWVFVSIICGGIAGLLTVAICSRLNYRLCEDHSYFVGAGAGTLAYILQLILFLRYTIINPVIVP
jgi:hypothetical protein